ncbi:helix-turn-helix domain-containing protein [Paenibacillus thalictri]|uniref:Helix-turn-helix domain-containing protein n=1 Tax=Paenibacillus thalictri TaxID=2527873 RepID=A0A4Q9DTG5_9BACL|nr:helix-turn-helix domain-containing protein [Paenibacillus thalictri]TBL78980.1 helix-turn-helix domain-containing protein [Paenibacillus thalictri]
MFSLLARSIAEWSGKIKRRKFLLRLISSILLLAAVPNLTFGIIAYFNVTKTFEHETSAANAKYLQQSMNALELVIQQITENCQQLALNPAFRNFEAFPNGTYYESLNGTLPEQDLPALYSYIDNKTTAIQSIEYFKLSNEFVDSVYYYDSNKNLVLMIKDENTFKQYSLESFFDKQWYGVLTSGTESPIILDPRMAMQFNHQSKRVLTLLFRTNQDDNAFIINLDAALIYHHIINRLNDKESLAVLSGGEAVLFATEQEAFAQTVKSALSGKHLQGSNGFIRSEVNGERNLVTYVHSDKLHWTFVDMINLNQLFVSTAYLRKVIVYSLALLLGLSVLLTFIASNRLYRPISRIQALMRAQWGRIGETWKDELHSIGDALRQSFDERDQFRRRLEESLPYYIEQFKNQLLRQPAEASGALQEKFADLHIPLEVSELGLLLLTFEERHPDAAADPVSESPWEMVRLLHELKRSSLANMPHMTVDTGNRHLAIVINTGKEEMHRVFALGAELIEILEINFAAPITVGVGRHCPSVGDLPRAFEEASEALRFRLLHGCGQVIYIGDIGLDGSNASDEIFSKKREERLIGYVKTGDAARAKEVVGELMEAWLVNKHRLHYTHIQFEFFKVITGVLSTLQQSSVDMARFIRSDPYREVMKLESMDQLAAWSDGFLQSAADCIGEEMNRKDNQHVSKVIGILEREHGSDLSLPLVSEMLNLNPAYVSRLFKQYTGKSFTEYLTEVRIEKSKELLQQTELKVNEVGSKVGYHNTYYFIKVFKEHAGMTPGEYKRIFGL